MYRSELPALRERVIRALAACEAFLSPTEWDLKNHNLIHLVEQIMVLGGSAVVFAEAVNVLSVHLYDAYYRPILSSLNITWRH